MRRTLLDARLPSRQLVEPGDTIVSPKMLGESPMSDASPLFEDAHRRILPARLDSGASEALAAEVRDLPPLAFRNPRGAEYTYRVRRSALVIEDGVDAAAVLVEISDQDWVGLWDASESVFGLLMAGRIEIKRGSPGDLVQWENALRALYENLPL